MERGPGPGRRVREPAGAGRPAAQRPPAGRQAESAARAACSGSSPSAKPRPVRSCGAKRPATRARGCSGGRPWRSWSSGASSGGLAGAGAPIAIFTSVGFLPRPPSRWRERRTNQSRPAQEPDKDLKSKRR